MFRVLFIYAGVCVCLIGLFRKQAKLKLTYLLLAVLFVDIPLKDFCSLSKYLYNRSIYFKVLL